MKALLIDHDDSFTFNLRHWLKPLFSEIAVINHADFFKYKTETVDVEKKFQLIVLSPGPKNPQDYPQTLQWLQSLPSQTPVFGVCLGLQMMTVATGHKVLTYSPPRHGRSSKLKILSPTLTLFSNAAVARYHSLVIEKKLTDFQILAESVDDQQPLWAEHTKKKWLGFQFHPESFLTEKSDELLEYLKNWMHA